MDPSQVPNVVFPIFFGSLSVATSLFIWYRTVKETQRRHEETMKVAQQRHEEVMKVAQQRHEEVLKEAQQRHRETVLLAVLAAQQRGQDPNFLYLRPLLRHVEETERDERALGSTGESILGAAVPVVVGSGDPPAVIQDDEKMPEGEAVCASFFQSPALHGARSSRRRSKSPDKPAVAMSQHSSTTPAWGGTRSSRESADLTYRAQCGADDGSFPPP
jgi:hypothetical protein